MRKTEITEFEKNLYIFLGQVIEQNKPIHISSTFGNAVLLSEQQYDSLLEAVCIYSMPDTEQSKQEHDLEDMIFETTDIRVDRDCAIKYPIGIV